MECDQVRRVISEHDGRVLRGRRIRAHLRTCEGCTDFRTAIETRRADLELVAPPLSAVAASGMFAGLSAADRPPRARAPWPPAAWAAVSAPRFSA